MNIFDRDAGNFKAWGALLLEGELEKSDIALLQSKFYSGEFFIAEQIGVPTPYEALWQECEYEPSEEPDHVWHEFEGVRLPTQEDLQSQKPWGTAKDFLASVTKIQTWKLEMSKNWEL